MQSNGEIITTAHVLQETNLTKLSSLSTGTPRRRGITKHTFDLIFVDNPGFSTMKVNTPITLGLRASIFPNCHSFIRKHNLKSQLGQRLWQSLDNLRFGKQLNIAI